MAKTDSVTVTLEQQESPIKGPVDTPEPRKKRFKPSTQTKFVVQSEHYLQYTLYIESLKSRCLNNF